jgi:hypothetical protein
MYSHKKEKSKPHNFPPKTVLLSAHVYTFSFSNYYHSGYKTESANTIQVDEWQPGIKKRRHSKNLKKFAVKLGLTDFNRK